MDKETISTEHLDEMIAAHYDGVQSLQSKLADRNLSPIRREELECDLDALCQRIQRLEREAELAKLDGVPLAPGFFHTVGWFCARPYPDLGLLPEDDADDNKITQPQRRKKKMKKEEESWDSLLVEALGIIALVFGVAIAIGCGAGVFALVTIGVLGLTGEHFLVFLAGWCGVSLAAIGCVHQHLRNKQKKRHTAQIKNSPEV